MPTKLEPSSVSLKKEIENILKPRWTGSETRMEIVEKEILTLVSKELARQRKEG